MLPRLLPPSPLPERSRSFKRTALPVLLASSVVLGTLAAVTGSAGSATAEPAGAITRTIGATPIALSQPTDPGIGKLAPSADAADNGMYGPQVAWPVIPLQIALSRNGHIISYGTPLDANNQGGLVYDDWDTSVGWARNAHFETSSMHDYNSFCNALVTLDDGKMLMVGGNSSMNSMVYDPSNGAQEMGANLAQQRWYATALRLTDGRVLVMGGANYYNSSAYLTPNDNSQVATTPEISSTGGAAWTQLTGATNLYAFGAEGNRWWYPRAFNGPNGTVVGMSGDHLWTLDPAGNGSVQPYGTLPWNPGVSGSQVMYTPGKILVAGGGQIINDDENVATNAAAIVDVTGPSAVVTPTNGMNVNRNWLNLTVLPTGEVLANGGTKTGTDAGEANSVKQAEVWNPATGQWRMAATAQRTRTYHSVSFVMPSGAVFTGGGGAPGPEDNLNAEVYYPSYLFTKGANGAVSWASRPTIAAISGSATYGGSVSLKIGDGRAIKSASLISAAVVTHAQNTDQRRIPLTITQNGGTVTATLPGSMNTMPAGDYELTVQDDKGVPSPAQMITIRRDGAGQVTLATGVPADAGAGNGAGTGGGTGGGTGTGTAPAPVNPGNPTGGSTGEGGSAGGSANTGTPGAKPEGSVKLTVDRTVGLDSVNKPGYRVSHSGSTTALRRVGQTSASAAKKATSWSVRPGLASAAGVSFEAVDKPGYYLAASAKGTGAVKLERADGTKRFAARATFAAVHGLTGQNTSFRLWSSRSSYLRHKGTSLVTAAFDKTDAGRFDSTFTVRAGLTSASAVPLTSGRSVALQPSDAASSRIRVKASKAAVAKVGATSSSAVKASASWVVRPGLSGKRGVSFESVGRPGYYLVASTHTTGTLVVAKRSSSKQFAARATFTAVAGASGHDRSLKLTAHPSLYLRHSGSSLVLQKLGGTKAARAAATVVVHSGLTAARGR